jgi:hypothetical protein
LPRILIAVISPVLAIIRRMSKDYISASEISEYLYCRRAWWYRRRGVRSATQLIMDTGTVQHIELATTTRAVEQRRHFAWRLLLAGLVVLIALLLLRGLLGL